MSSPRPLRTRLAVLLLIGVLVAMLVVLGTVRRDLQRAELARRTASSDVALLNEDNQKLRVGLQAAEEGQARLAEEAKKATEEAVALRSELVRLQSRVEAMKTARRTAGVALQELKAAPAPDPAAHRGEVPAAQRENPPLQYRAARRAFEKRGFAGFCQAVGIDEKVQPRFREAYEAFLLRAREADKAHADVTVGEDAVVIFIDLYGEEGHALHKAWEDIFTPILTPDQKKAYIDAYGDAVLFKRPFGHYTQTIALTRDAFGVSYTHRGERSGGTPTFEVVGTVAGEDAVDKLPWLHLLTNEAVAKLRGPDHL